MSKASKNRTCPAIDGIISAKDCGQQRHSHLVCPASCPHDPFAQNNYPQLLEIDQRLDALTVQRLASLAPDPSGFQRQMLEAKRQSLLAVHALVSWELFFAKAPDQTTFAERWARSDWSGLKNDEQVLWRGKSQTRIALLEVHKVLTDGEIEAIDLLSPEPKPLLFLDRNTSQTCCRFSTFLCWIYPLPHFWRLSGTAITFPEMTEFTAPEITREIVGHLGGPPSEAEMRIWLAEHFSRFNSALRATTSLRHRKMIEQMDSSYRQAVYELLQPLEKISHRLDTLPDIAVSDLNDQEIAEGFSESRDWFDPSAPTHGPNPLGVRHLLGRVLLGPERARLEAMGQKKLSRMRETFEKHLGKRVLFVKDLFHDHTAQMSSSSPPVDSSLVPPRLLLNIPQITALSSAIPLSQSLTPETAMDAYQKAADDTFLDSPIPLLDHQTPRAAAKDLVLRPKLLELMKHRIRNHDERNLEKGRSEDINWITQELELGEINFPPPPWRPPTEAPEKEDWQEAIPLAPSTSSLSNRPEPPVLIGPPLDLPEAMDKLGKAMDYFANAAEAESEMLASGSILIDEAERFASPYLEPDEFYFFIPFIIHLWFYFVPPGSRAPKIDYQAIETSFDKNLNELTKTKNPDQIQDLLQQGPQPGLLLALTSALINASTTAPKEIRPDQTTVPLILLLLKAIIESLDRALRNPT